MAFDINSATPVEPDEPERKGFDLASAQPVDTDKNRHTSEEFDDKPEYNKDGVQLSEPASRMEKLLRKAKGGGLLKGVAEAGLSAVTGLGSTIAGGLAGAGRAAYSLASGEGVDEAVRKGSETIQSIQMKGTFQPRSAAGQLLTGVSEEVGGAPAKVSGMALGELGESIGGEQGRIAGESIGEAAVPIGATAAGGVSGLKAARKAAMREPQPVPGKDFSPLRELTPDQSERLARQKQQGMEPTLGSVTRDPEQFKFEEQMAKTKAGTRLREIELDNNDALIKLVQETDTKRAGKALAENEREVGRAIFDAIEEKRLAKKQEIRDLYTKAQESGETKAVVDIKPLERYLKENEAEMITVPALKSIQAKLDFLKKRKGEERRVGMVKQYPIEELNKALDDWADMDVATAMKDTVKGEKVDSVYVMGRALPDDAVKAIKKQATMLQDVSKTTNSGASELYRGMALSPDDIEKLQPGKLYRLDTLTSASHDKEVALAYADTEWALDIDNPQKVILHFKNPNGVVGVVRPEAYEVILPKGAAYRVVKRWVSDGVTNVTLESKAAPVNPKGKRVGVELTVDDLENLYQSAGALSKPDDPSSKFMGDIKRKINEMTENVGGALYKDARRARLEYGLEFEDRAAIANIYSKRSGSRTDYKVATEDIFQKTVVKSSLDELKDVTNSLLSTDPKTNPKAWQAVREMQAQAIDYLVEKSTKGIGLNERTVESFSPAAYRQAMKDIGRDKLNWLLGDDAVKRLYDALQTAREFKTVPGKVSGSDTAVNAQNLAVRMAREEAMKHLKEMTPGLKALTGFLDARKEGKLLRNQIEEAATPHRAPVETIEGMKRDVLRQERKFRMRDARETAVQTAPAAFGPLLDPDDEEGL